MYVAAHNAARIWGGAERATARLLAGLQRRGHRVRLYCNDPLVQAGAAALGVPAEILPLGGDVALPHALRLARVLRRERPDVFLVGTFKKLWLASLAAHLAGVPRVIARVGLETDTPRSAKYRMALRRWVDRVVVNASAMRPAFLAEPGWNAERVVVIPNGVELPRPRHEPGWLRGELGIPPDAPVIGSVARLAAQKRLDRLVAVLPELPPETHCVIAGEGEMRSALEAQMRAAGVEDRIHLLGERDDLGEVFAAMDLYVVTSDREGMSNAMLEALAAGVPAVSTPVSGAGEALRPLPDGRRPGVVLPDFAPEPLATVLGDLLRDPAALRGMGEAAGERAREEFSLERMLDRWEAALASPLR